MHRSFQQFCVVLCLVVVAGCDPCMNNPCNDGIACNGLETCTADGGQAVCADGVAVICASSELCTEPDGDCDASGDPVCRNPCDDGDACTENDECDDDGICTGAAIRCDTGEVCAVGVCVCGDDSACDDGDACTGIETCVDGFCVAGTPVDCPEGEVCVDGTCEPDGDTCDAVARTITIFPPGGTFAYGVEDNPPAGWTISNISHHGEYDATNDAVKWAFIDSDPRTLSYTATLDGATGTHCFDGVVNYDGDIVVDTASKCVTCN